jgi:hypothetical protein
MLENNNLETEIEATTEVKKKKKRYGKKRTGGKSAPGRAGSNSSNNKAKAIRSQKEGLADNSLKYPFLYKLKITDQVAGVIGRLLDTIVTGTTSVFSTPYVEDEGGHQNVVSLVDKIFENKQGVINSVLKDIELKQRDKIGPRSIAVPWKDRRDSVYDYFGESTPVVLDIIMPQSASMGSLQPISKMSSIELLKNSTNSGLPYFTRKSNVKDKLLEEWDDLMDRNDPCVLFTRTQEGKKTRGVWGYPAINSANEMRFYSPLLAYQRKQSWRSVLNSPDDVAVNITNILVKSKISNKTMVSVDFTAYDASVRTHLQYYSFEYIKKLFMKNYYSDIDNIKYTFGNISLVTPDGIISGQHGVPSGSTFTNEIDSIAQYLVAMNSGFVKDSNIQVQGDDGVYSINDDDVDSFIKYFNSCGLQLNDTKSVISKDYCVYLQNLYHVDYINNESIIPGIYPIYRALNRILYQERYVNFKSVGLSGADYYTIRTISILENCKNHPLFEDFVKVIVDLDKNSLLVNQDTINKYSKIKGEEASFGNIMNQYGDNLNEFSKFKTVEVINRLRNNSPILA